ncbi:ABC transporter permease [Glaciimonas soli]|uniref:ABC transporter permease subunit n=1 Tax=Glaciimonas soli TaxID=2590999 RepID=A0A843YYC3_9BURK|nr:ABC transporter permease subunit [Glaciimonas soli]MQR02664.1 ABC transporter permease subunit [Glaciimonas soli]
MFPTNLTFSMVAPVNDFVDGIVTNYGDFFHAMAHSVMMVLVFIEKTLQKTPWWLFIGIVAALAFVSLRKISQVALVVLGLMLIGSFGLWDKMMQTTALVVVATFLTVMIGIPIGIIVSCSERVRKIVLPILDIMQTMPVFVYLIPVLMLFGLGKVPAVFATVIYAVSPLIRLTNLGIRQVNPEVVEAAIAFGANRWQLMLGVQLPLAMPSIMAGINQTNMMALAMVVVSSMIGANGLGIDVLEGINNQNIGLGLQAGIAIVILAIIIDRVSQGFGADKRSN